MTKRNAGARLRAGRRDEGKTLYVQGVNPHVDDLWRHLTSFPMGKRLCFVWDQWVDPSETAKIGPERDRTGARWHHPDDGAKRRPAIGLSSDGGAKDADVTAIRDLDSILQQLRRLQPELKRRYPIKEMGVFGSYVRGEQREDSDLDVLVDLGDGVTLIDFVGLQLELSDALGMTVDLVMKDFLKPRISQHVLSEVVVL